MATAKMFAGDAHYPLQNQGSLDSNYLQSRDYALTAALQLDTSRKSNSRRGALRIFRLRPEMSRCQLERI